MMVTGTIIVAVMAGYVANIDIGNLSALGFSVVAAICPLGFLETLLADKSIVLRALFSFVAVVILIIIFGRAFCAWVCPVPLIQRILPKKRHPGSGTSEQSAKLHQNQGPVQKDTGDGSVVGKTAFPVKLDSRHLVLGGSLLSAALFGFPVFCIVCPVGLSFATILVLFRLFGFGETTLTLFVFPAILLLELLVFRKWCSKICPLGALVSLVAGMNRFFRPQIDETRCLVSSQGLDCSSCHAACSRENIDPRSSMSSKAVLSDCTKCRDCADACPTKAISFPFFARSPSTGSVVGQAGEKLKKRGRK
jgi:ferredoxin-type protein NapH